MQIQSNMKGYYEKRIDITPNQLNIPHNHRRIFIDEVIFDIDCHIRGISNKIHDFISSNLIKDDISHSVWDTSRSPHIHCFFKDLNLYPQEIRIQIKKLIIKHYTGEFINFVDLSKASENNMIRDFNGKHEITGKNKVLIYEYENKAKTLLNSLKQEILEQLRFYYIKQENIKNPSNFIGKSSISSDFRRELQDFISYCCENIHKHDGKERILFKNIAIACLLLDYDTNARHRIYHNVIKNCNTRRHITELINWDKWASRQKELHFSWKQISLWYKRDLIKNE